MSGERVRSVQAWEAERDQRPTKEEMAHWELTVAELEAQLRLEDDPSRRSDLHHRLATAHVKMEMYSEARQWAETGLDQGVEEWKERLTHVRAQALYLSGHVREALDLLPEEGNPEEAPTVEALTPEAPKAVRPIQLRCPGCHELFSYGQVRCPICGEKVDGRFPIVRPSGVEGGYEPLVTAKPHRTKHFSFILSEYTVDYDDPLNFLTIHRFRFMGGEITTVVEREWVKWVWLAIQLLLYVPYLWLVLALAGRSQLWPVVAILLLMLVFLVPFTYLYLWAMIPSVQGPMDPTGR